MSHVESYFTRNSLVVVATALCVVIVVGMAGSAYAGDGDGVGGFKYKIKMEGDENNVEPPGAVLLGSSAVVGPEGPQLFLAETGRPEAEPRSYLLLARFLAFLIRH